MKRYTIVVFGVLGTLFFIVSSILGGLWIEGYSFMGQYISESFATGVRNAAYLRYMYIISGILLLIFSLTVPTFFPKSKGIKIGFLVFGLFYGLGNVIVALFPCDAGCPMDIQDSSFAQVLHNMSAFLTYSIVPFSLMYIGFSTKKNLKEKIYSNISILAGILALVFVVFLFGNPQGPYIGLFQRIIEGSILSWVIYTAFYIQRTNT